MTSPHEHKWSEPETWTVDMWQARDFRWCFECGTLHYFGVEHMPANKSLSPSTEQELLEEAKVLLLARCWYCQRGYAYEEGREHVIRTAEQWTERARITWQAMNVAKTFEEFYPEGSADECALKAAERAFLAKLTPKTEEM
jgi:hypothetical protein